MRDILCFSYSMYSIIHETDDSTTVNFSEAGKFFPENGPQLLTIGGKYLRIHRINPYGLIPENDQQWKQTARLECLLFVRLLAPVRSLAIARIPQNPDFDSLLLAFDDAKLSIVCINAAERTLRTVSLHSFEDELLRDGYVTDLPSPVIRVDPSQRCCAMLVFGRHIAIVPFDDSSSHLHSYTIPLSSVDSRLVNIIDMVFLDGYYEPTLLFLYEPAQTTAGRQGFDFFNFKMDYIKNENFYKACLRYDTMCIIGVSLNVNEQVQAAVWQLTSMPMDCSWMLPVPRPIGGIMVFATNSLIYLNQSVPPCGIVVNSCTDGFTKFPLRDMKSMAVSLEGSVACCIDVNKIILSIRDGKMFLLTLNIDETNSVKSLDLQEQFETSIPYTISFLAPGYLFVGSRLGDSMLIQYTYKKATGLDESLYKKSKVETLSEKVEEDEDIELYGKALLPVRLFFCHDCEHIIEFSKLEEQGTEKLEFRVIDRLPNVGPCKKMTAGCPHGINSYFQQISRRDPLFDLICACGHSKDASICIFQRSIRPDIITSSGIEGVFKYWAVGRREDDTHKYIIASKEYGSLILETDNDLVELETPIFITSESTVAAGELADGGISVQVTTSSVVIVADDQQLQFIPLQLTFPAISASIVDPFIAICTQNGKLLLYELVNHPHIHLKEVEVPNTLRHSHSPITALSLYRDMSGIIRFCSVTKSSQPSMGVSSLSNEDFDDMDDFLLYGDSIRKQKETKVKRRIVGLRQEAPALETDIIDPNTIVPSHWIVLARENGNLYIYSIPELQLVYMVRKMCNLQDVVSDELSTGDDNLDNSELNLNAIGDSFAPKSEEIIMEVLLFGMGMNQARPMLLLLVDDVVSVYEMFIHDNGIQGHLALRFKRLRLSSVIRSNRFQSAEGRTNLEVGRDAVRHRTILHPFERIGNILNGIFICSSYPVFFFVDSGVPRLHPLNLDGALLSFTTFNNIVCPNGFIYLTEKSRKMRIARLPNELELDASYPFRRIHVGKTIHQILYLMLPNVFVLSTSGPKIVKKLCLSVNEEKSFEEFERSDTFIYPVADQYMLQLYSPEDWKPIPNAEIRLDEFEVVAACEEVLLKSESTVSGVQNYLAVGTSYNYGEEVLVRGRIILSEIIEVVPEPGQPTTRHRIKTLYDKEQKGPVTSLCSCNGFLLTGMGQKIFIWAFRDNNLQGISFLDMHFYVHHLVGIRNLALACDIYQSLALIRYQEEFKALSLASRDMRNEIKFPMVSQFLIDNKQMGFVMSDEFSNITVFNYLPETLESCGGEKLIVRAEINIGTNVNTMIRVKGHVSSGFIESEQFSLERQSIIFASLDGSFGFIRPLTEKVFRRLHMLQQLICSTVIQAAGLNARGSRAARPLRPSHYLNTRNIVDGDVVMQYMHLSLTEKNDLARKLGTSRYHIMDDLTEIYRVTTHY
ncbi:unnamed protein product [Dracunculus medinensis]|uniref:CPSF_A domain-containing protein n=1 Tax=Dracunculus medinensis TaxID=318479 RepID=A0A0N4UEB6_DRAME|nr:unnamed protein product [Dracunculus medinensis]